MSLQTNLKGRLRNTSLPKSNGLMPVFEAVVNSIHSIEEKGNLVTGGKITLHTHRATQATLDIGTKAASPIVGFTIRDNGCGFDNTNFVSFETLDSDHKIDKGCRGVGRLLWLKAFDQVEITSVFLNKANEYQQRSFSFDDKLGVHNDNVSVSQNRTTGSAIELKDFDDSYRKAVPTKTESIANQLLEHCLWYFVRAEGAPEITVHDGSESFNLYLLYDDHMHASTFHEKIDIVGQSFELTHTKFRASVNKEH